MQTTQPMQSKQPGDIASYAIVGAIIVVVVLLMFLLRGGFGTLSGVHKKEKYVNVDDQAFVPLPEGIVPGRYYVSDGWVWYIDDDDTSLGNYVRRPVFGPGPPVGGPTANLSNIKVGLPMVGDYKVRNGDVIRSNWTGAIARVENGSLRLFTHMDSYTAAGSPPVTVNADMHFVPHMFYSAPLSLATNGLYAGTWRSNMDII